MIPEHLLGGLERYRDERIRPGDCLACVLSNDLFGALQRADPETERAMPAIVRWVYNELPGNAWGSPAAVDAWLAEGRMAAS